MADLTRYKRGRRKSAKPAKLPKLTQGPSARARERANANASFKRTGATPTTPARDLARYTRPIPGPTKPPAPTVAVGTATYGTMGQRTGTRTTYGTMSERTRFKKQGNGTGPPIPVKTPGPSARARERANANASFKRTGATPTTPARDLARYKPAKRRKP